MFTEVCCSQYKNTALVLEQENSIMREMILKETWKLEANLLLALILHERQLVIQIDSLATTKIRVCKQP